ncbi:MAG: tetratricopeptide repeat protein [Fibrobacter sp.]|nr:tetratricopeptide repeat protein [Fibrobacter sp.]
MNNGFEYLQEAKRLQKCGLIEQATELLQFCIDNDVESCEASHQLGILKWGQHRFDEAINLIKNAIAKNPDVAQYRYNLGTMYQMLKRINEALEEYEQVLKIDPEHSGALVNLSTLYCQAGRASESEMLCRLALKNDSGSSEIWNNLGNALREQGRIDEALNAYSLALGINPHSVSYSNYLLCLCYQSSYQQEHVFSEHKKWGTLKNVSEDVFVKPAGKVKYPLRVGYVSGDFCDHAVSRFFLPVLVNHNRSNIEPYCYSNSRIYDAVTDKIKSLSTFRTIHLLSDDEVRCMIIKDEIDILIDLSGHTAGNRLTLFAKRAAPVQGTYLGYPNTTGLNTIDFRITDELVDPEGQQQYHTEMLMHLPHGFICYLPPESLPAILEPPCLKNGFITFGSFNNLVKITPKVIELWSLLLLKFKDSRLLLKNRGFADPKVREHYRNQFLSRGISEDRLVFCGPLNSSFDHLAAYNQIDIALDTFPYNGTTTTCEALIMGVPVLALKGCWHASRVSYSILSRIGLSSLCSTDQDHLLRNATHLLSDFDSLVKLRTSLRQAVLKSSLCDGKTLTEEIEQVFLSVVEKKYFQRQHSI